jgi:hypothetical protein
MSSSHGMKAALSLDGTAKGLGVFSIGLGLTELLAPHAVAQMTGLRGRETLIRAYGLREIATGIGLLVSADPRPWLWGRVLGDVLDVATLAVPAAGTGRRAANARRAIAAAAPIGAVDLATARAADAKAKARAGARFDYSGRIGMAQPAEAMRGAARDFMAPRDMRQPEALRPHAHESG